MARNASPYDTSKPPPSRTRNYLGMGLTAVLFAVFLFLISLVLSISVNDNSLRPAPLPVALTLGKLAFVESGDIWVKNLPDGVAHRLTTDGLNHTPLWSPSGEWLAFHKDRSLWVVRGSGTKALQLDGNGASQFAWSPIEDRLAFIDQGKLYVVSTNDFSRKELVAPGAGEGAGISSFAWSPNGLWLAYAKTDVLSPALKQGQQGSPPDRYASLWRINADGSTATELVNSGKPSGSYGYEVAGWSPDGSLILYWPVASFSPSILADGSALKSVSALGGGSIIDIAETMLAYRDFLAWSPDGRQLALSAGRSRMSWEDKAIIITTQGGISKTLSADDRADLFPTWSPAGRYIAFTSGPAVRGIGGGDAAKGAVSQRHIWLASSDGEMRQQLTDDPSFRDERPLWSANALHILFVRVQGEQAQLWLMQADGTEQQQVVDELSPNQGWFGYYGYIDWSRLYDWWTGLTPSPRIR